MVKDLAGWETTTLLLVVVQQIEKQEDMFVHTGTGGKATKYTVGIGGKESMYADGQVGGQVGGEDK